MRILIVDDDDSDRLAVRRCLRQCGLMAELDEVASAADAQLRIAAERYDCVLLDYYLPGADTVSLVLRMREAATDTPVVILTGRGDENIAVEFMKSGAADYVPKASLTPERLAASIRYALEITRAAAARRSAEQERELLLAREQQARTAAEQATRAREEVLAILAHDLRDPMQTIHAAATVLAHQVPEQNRRHVAIIDRAIQTMQRLVTDLLDVARMDAGTFSLHKERIEVDALVRDVLEMYEPQALARGIMLGSDIDRGIAPIEADRDRLRQVLSNLLGNALKFTPAKGSIAVRAADCEGGVEVAVRDSGPGIPGQDLERIFNRFWQLNSASRTGAGLGLAICKAVVEAHGGRVWADSELGRGSTFHVFIPRTPPAAGS